MFVRSRISAAVTVTVALGIVAGAGGVGVSTASAAAADCPWATSTAPIPERVAQLLSVMTTAQKLDLVGGANSKYAGATTAVPSLCIPALTLQDGPAGVGDSIAEVTQLPAPIDLAATFDTAAAYQYGNVIGAEDRIKGADVDLGPTVNIVRDPRWGRAFETYGEDPYLSGMIGDGYIEGVQSNGVMAQVKHLAAYDEETGRDSPLTSDSIVSDRALQEIYLPPFADAIKHANVSSMMCSYNQINGTPACSDGYTMTQVIDEQYDFKGFITSDWYATQNAAPAANAGLDMQMPDACYFNTGLSEDIGDGQVPESQLNGMAGRILTEMFRFKMIGRMTPTGSLSNTATSTSHQQTALQIAEEGTALLKNAGGVLPLNRSTVGSIAVIGADASANPVTAGAGSATVESPGTTPPLGAIAALAGSGVKVTYDDGSSTSSAAAVARSAKVAVVFADLAEGEFDDLPDIDLSGNQNALISAVSAANPNTIVVLNTGDGVTMPWLASVKGVLEAWYPGQEDGTAIARLLFGDADPSGKLPVTFPTSISQVSTSGNWPSLGKQTFGEGIFVGYRWFEKQNETPLFPFGYGLSYTRFKISHGRVALHTRTGRLTVRVTVTNTGSKAGSDVVEMYVGDPPVAGEPPRQLKGFTRVTLTPGAQTRVTLHLTPLDLSYWNNRWTAPAGTYTVYVGDSSALSGLPVVLHTRLTRTVLTGSAPGPATSTGTDSPLLLAQCPQDVLLPTGNSLLTVGGLSETSIADLP